MFDWLVAYAAAANHWLPPKKTTNKTSSPTSVHWIVHAFMALRLPIDHRQALNERSDLRNGVRQGAVAAVLKQ